MKNILAIVSGVVVSLMLIAVVAAVAMRFQIEPFISFGREAFPKSELGGLQNKIVYINSFIVFPVISLITGVVVGRVANSKKYIMGLISIIPIMALAFNPSFYSALSVMEIVVAMAAGVVLSKHLKIKKR